MMTTIKSLTDSQIRRLQGEASAAGDFAMAAICDLAIKGDFSADDWTTLDARDARRIASMTRDDAYAAIVDAIREAAVQIRVTSSTDWGCEHTDEDREAYEQAVADAIARAYPGADVEVKSALVSRTQVRVYNCRASEEDTIVDACRGIAQDVWDRSDFWVSA